jgi:hypothetical protein
MISVARSSSIAPADFRLRSRPADSRRVDSELNAGERRELRRKADRATLEALRCLGGEARRQDIRDRALADGAFTARELAAPAPAGAAQKFARLVDHHLSWALTNLKRDGLVERPARSVWRLAGAALEAPVPASDEPIFVDRLDELARMPYRDYLRTPEWRVTRAAALERAGHCCSLDVTHVDGLEVHHRTYERLGCELSSDLVVLCHACHALHHGEHGRPRRSRAASASPPATARPRPAAPSMAAAPQPGPDRPRSLLRRIFSS